METIDYKVQLENFYGPLDLLLYLIRENELNIYEIPIARVAEQYLNYLEMMKKLDINLAGEFLVIASTLIEIKARMLVPAYEQDDVEEEDEDPKFELIRRLLEYKKYKDIAVKLRGLIEIQSKTFPRPEYRISTEQPDNQQAGQPEIKPDESQIELDVWQVVKAYAKLSKEIVLDIPLSILYDDIPIEKVIEGILKQLQQKGEVFFRNLLTEKPDRINIVRNFLATLELARRKSIEVQQENDFGDIKIKLVASN